MKKRKGQLTLIKESLERLAAIREETGGWLDSEQEEEEQSCLFKIMESLEPFFLANRMFPTDFARFPIKEEILLEDLNRVVEIIGSDGFSASPYLYVREEAEFVDSAALALRLMIMVGEYVEKTVLKKDPNWSGLLEKVFSVATRACDFILKSGLVDKTGLRWAGTTEHSIKRTNYCNVYFTCQAARALLFCLRQKETFSVGDDEKKENAIRDSCRWLLGRVRENTVFGDERRSRGEINYGFYGLSLLLDCSDYLEERQKAAVLKVFTRFVEQVGQGEEFLTWLNYIDVPLKDYPKPIFYDDRSGYGNIVTVLCKGRDVFREQAVIDNRFFEILNLWHRYLVNQRDPETLLWEQGNFLICYTARAIEGLLYFAKYGEAVKYELSEQEMLEVLKKTLESPQIQQVFLREIARIGRAVREDRK